MISIDIETTGLDPDVHQILEFAAVLENGEKFNYLVKHENYVMSPYCLDLHKDLLPLCIKEGFPVGALGFEFKKWLEFNGVKIPYAVVGANFAGFDGRFLRRAQKFPPWDYHILDIGSLYFNGKRPLSLHEIEQSDTPHRAMPDAEAVMRAYLRKRIRTFDFGNGPVPAHPHSNGSGWIANTANVAKTVYIGPLATVYDSACIYGNAQIHGKAQVHEHARVYGNAQIYGKARVYGDAVVYGNAKVHNHAEVFGSALVCGDAHLYGCSQVSGKDVVMSETNFFGDYRKFGRTT